MNLFKKIGTTIADNWDIFSGVTGTGLALSSWYGGANTTAKQSQLGLKSAYGELEALNQRRSIIPEVVQSRKDVAQDEYGLAIKQEGFKSQLMSNALYDSLDKNEGAQKFSYYGGIEKSFDDASQQIKQQSFLSRLTSKQQLDKMEGMATAWGEEEKAKADAEERRIRAQIEMYKQTDTLKEALGF
tara:strand:+ start:4513 stop:5070 length:558 start_codon:yes stop_codon:yes gene_type:complete